MGGIETVGVMNEKKLAEKEELKMKQRKTKIMGLCPLRSGGQGPLMGFE